MSNTTLRLKPAAATRVKQALTSLKFAMDNPKQSLLFRYSSIIGHRVVSEREAHFKRFHKYEEVTEWITACVADDPHCCLCLDGEPYVSLPGHKKMLEQVVPLLKVSILAKRGTATA